MSRKPVNSCTPVWTTRNSCSRSVSVQALRWRLVTRLLVPGVVALRVISVHAFPAHPPNVTPTQGRTQNRSQSNRVLDKPVELPVGARASIPIAQTERLSEFSIC